MKKTKQEKSEGGEAELSEGGEEQESAKAKEAFEDGEKDGDVDDDEECEGPELPSGLTGKEEPLCVCKRNNLLCVMFVGLPVCYRLVCVLVLYISFPQELLRISRSHHWQSL